MGIEGVSLIQSASPQIVGDDDVGDGVEDELDVGGVRGARHVTINLLGGTFVFRLELGLDVGGGLVVFLRAAIFRETNGQRRLFDLFLEKIFFVKKEDDGGVGEPFVVANRIEQLQRLVHSIRRVVLVQDLVTKRVGGAEGKGRG